MTSVGFSVTQKTTTMFKAKLIENEQYYGLRSKQLLLYLLPVIPLGIVVAFYQIPAWLAITAIGIYGLWTILFVRNQRRINSMLGEKLVEIDGEAIRIMSKKGDQEEAINLNDVDKITLKHNYSMAQETMRDIGKELTGNMNRNYVILQHGNKERKLDFEVDSHYMLNQLSKVIKDWESKAYNIVKVD